MYRLSFQFKNVFLSLKSNFKETVRTSPQFWSFVIGDRQSMVDDQISDYICSAKMLKVAHNLCFLYLINKIPNETEGRINHFYTTLAKKWEDCSQHRYHLLKRHYVCGQTKK